MELETYKGGIIKYTTLLSFWIMVVLWEIEGMRLISYIADIKWHISFIMFFRLLQYDSTMVLVTIFNYINSAFYFHICGKKFGLFSLALSVLFLYLVVMKTYV